MARSQRRIEPVPGWLAVNATRLSALLVVGIPLVYAACGGDNLTLPSEGAPAHIVVIGGSPQSGRVGDQLAAPLVVKVTDTQDRPVAGATVNFTFDDAAAGGSAQPASGTTNGDGEASSIIRLGPRVGLMSGHATVPVPEGTVPVTVPFTLTALSADAFGIAAVSGEGQNGQVGATLPESLVVQVSDNFGNPIPNITVEWSVTGGGSVNPASTQTDVNGRAAVSRTLGNSAGEWTTVATATGLAGSPVTFIHQVGAGNASRVEIVSGNGQNAQAGTELSEDLVVRVLDANDNPISQRAVEWVIGEGGGTANPARSNTDGQGYARTSWTLGPAPGRNTLNAVVSGVGEGRVTFTATGTSTGSTTRITSMNPDQSIVGQRVAVSVSVSGNGGTPTGSVTVNGESVAQPCTITLANGSGSCEIAFTAPGNHRVTATYGGDSRFGGSSDDANHRVSAANSAPTAAYNPPSCVVGTPCQFTDGSSDSDGDVVGWTWDFGDEQTSDQENPQHMYLTSGSFDVKLTVRDDDGATSEVTHQVAVTLPPPQNSPPTASFNPPGIANPPSCHVGVPCQFTDASTDSDGTVVGWNWNFGDDSGNAGTDVQNPTHMYLGAETFTVTLVVTDDDGAVSTPFSAPVTVEP
jgi:PKD repeat protein